MKIFQIANNVKIQPKTRVEDIKSCLLAKGYGDREQELSFIRDFFMHVFKNHPSILFFEWSQYQDYNDNYLNFDLESYKVNDIYDVDVYGFDWWDDEEDWNYHFDNEDLWKSYAHHTQEEWELVYDNLQKKLQPVKLATDCIFSLLKALYDFYKPYYFIYVFGRRARVKVSVKGIEIDHVDIDFINGNSYDKEFDLR